LVERSRECRTVRAGTRFSENFDQLLIITDLQASSFHHLFVQPAYPDAVAPGV
jgi:RNA polymerase subunit RPABC4/transcription elongation factor Spt4